MAATLRSKLIRLAHEHPEFRPALLPLVKEAGVAQSLVDSKVRDYLDALELEIFGLRRKAEEAQDRYDRVAKARLRMTLPDLTFLEKLGIITPQDADAARTYIR